MQKPAKLSKQERMFWEDVLAYMVVMNEMTPGHPLHETRWRANRHGGMTPRDVTTPSRPNHGLCNVVDDSRYAFEISLATANAALRRINKETAKTGRLYIGGRPFVVAPRVEFIERVLRGEA